MSEQSELYRTENNRLQAENAKLRAEMEKLHRESEADFKSTEEQLSALNLQLDALKHPDLAHWSTTALALKAAQRERDAALLQNYALIDAMQGILQGLATVPSDSPSGPLAMSLAGIVNYGLKKAGVMVDEMLTEKPKQEGPRPRCGGCGAYLIEMKCVECDGVGGPVAEKRICGMPSDTGIQCTRPKPHDGNHENNNCAWDR